MLDIPVLTERWGKLFGVMNEVDSFRGDRLFELADLINALFPMSDEQRIVVDTLYERTRAADNVMNDIVSYYMTLVKNTLIQMSLDDGLLIPIDASDAIVLNKLISDMLTQAKSFQYPAVTINGTLLMATGTPITTLQGPPTGNGVILGTVANPRLGKDLAKIHVYTEQVKFVCSADSYKAGIDSGQETFDVTSKSFITYDDSDWPRGSGVNTKFNSIPTSQSTLISNAYFNDWDDSNVNIPLNWLTNNLVPGTTLRRSTDAYSGEYAVELRGAPGDAELKQEINGLQGTTSYIAGFRIKRPLAIAGSGEITLALVAATGNVIDDAAGEPIQKIYDSIGGATAYELFSHVFTIPKGYSQPVYLSIRVTDPFPAGAIVIIDNVELIPMVEIYPDGPAFGFVPGNIGWAINDTYTFDVTNTGGKETFVGNLERTYQMMALGIDIPTSVTPTELDTLINVTP